MSAWHAEGRLFVRTRSEEGNAVVVLEPREDGSGNALDGTYDVVVLDGNAARLTEAVGRLGIKGEKIALDDGELTLSWASLHVEEEHVVEAIRAAASVAASIQPLIAGDLRQRRAHARLASRDSRIGPDAHARARDHDAR